MKSAEQYFHVVLFTMLYKVFLTFESVHELNKPLSVIIQMKAIEQCFNFFFLLLCHTEWFYGYSEMQ